jgi:TIR domain
VGRLKANGLEVFYDQDKLAEMWGENLLDFLQAVYKRRARYAILIISQHYVDKKWPGHERQAAQDRALQQGSPYILPIRLDDAELPGLHSTVGYMDARYMGMEGLVEAVLKKVGSGSAAPAPPAFDGKVPRSSEAIATLLSERPPGWEYLLFGAGLRRGIDALEDKYLDHTLEYAKQNGKHLDDEGAVALIKESMTPLLGIIESFNRIMSPGAQEAAFGKPGEPGEPDRILHLANRFASVYEELLDFAANLRATGIGNEDLRRAAHIQARFVNQPLTAMREFVDNFVAEVDTLTERLKRAKEGEEAPIRLEMVITLKLADELVEQHRQALNAYGASI